MARFKLEDGAIVDTDRAAKQWAEASEWNGSNHISKATGDQWLHETSSGQWLFQSVNWRLPRPAAFKPLKEATIADLRDLIGRIPSFTHLSEDERQEYARESQAALEMVSNV